MTADEFAFSTEAREKMLRGIDTLAGAVRVTLGPLSRVLVVGTGENGRLVARASACGSARKKSR